MLGVNNTIHVEGAISPELMASWEFAKPEMVIPARDLPDLDDIYVFAERVTLARPLLHYFGPIGGDKPTRHEFVALWVIGFEGRGPAKQAFCLEFRPVSIFKPWAEATRTLLERHKAGAVIPMTDEIGIGLYLSDPSLPIVSPLGFLRNKWMFM